jgi:hypothetical protein
MNSPEPSAGAGRTSLDCIKLVVLIVAFFLLTIAVEEVTGCRFNEGGIGTCKILGVELFSFLNTVTMVANYSLVFLAPILVLVAAITGVNESMNRD